MAITTSTGHRSESQPVIRLTEATSSLKGIFSMDKWIVLNAVARNVIKALRDAGVYVKPKASDQQTIRGIIDKLQEPAIAAGFKRTDILVEIGRINGRLANND